jgi:prolyl 4-hydroxylase
MTSKILNNTPHVEVFDNFLSKEELESIDLNKKYKKSGGFSHSIGMISTNSRKSQTYYVPDDSFDFVKNRAFIILKEHLPHIEPICLEDVQLTKYSEGDYFDPHWDFYNIPFYKNYTRNDRCATFMIYLNDDYENGTTYFPKLNLHITPKAGSALFFKYNYNLENNVKTLHSGEKVTKGVKYIASIWVRNYDANDDFGKKVPNT